MAHDPSSPDLLRTKVTSDAGTTTVTVDGEIDASTAPGLRAALAEVVAAAPAVVRLDLGAVTFIDSVGISVLVSAHHRCEAEGSVLEVWNATAGCQRLFAITRLDGVLRLRP